MWLSLRAISMSASAANSRRICSSALGGTIRSAVEPPLAGTSIVARRCPLVATMRIRSGRSSHSTPLRIGRLSSVDAANATWPTSLCTTPAAAFHAPSNFTAGNDGNSSRGSPSSLNFDRPHSIPTRDSPAAVIRTGPEGSSRAMSTNFLAGSVTAPSASTSAGRVVLGVLAIRPIFPPCRGASTPAHISLPTCWLECGQLLTRHFHAFLERPVPHHLPLHLVHRVNHRRVVPPAERLPDLH